MLVLALAPVVVPVVALVPVLALALVAVQVLLLYYRTHIYLDHFDPLAM